MKGIEPWKLDRPYGWPGGVRVNPAPARLLKIMIDGVQLVDGTWCMSIRGPEGPNRLSGHGVNLPAALESLALELTRLASDRAHLLFEEFGVYVQSTPAPSPAVSYEEGSGV